MVFTHQLTKSRPLSTTPPTDGTTVSALVIQAGKQSRTDPSRPNDGGILTNRIGLQAILQYRYCVVESFIVCFDNLRT